MEASQGRKPAPGEAFLVCERMNAIDFGRKQTPVSTRFTCRGRACQTHKSRTCLGETDVLLPELPPRAQPSSSYRGGT